MTRTAVSPSGKAKILKTQRLVVDALKQLTATAPPSKLTITEVCRTAGITLDTLALPHHAELRTRVETTIVDHNATHFGKKRKKLNPASDVAVARIERLETELGELKARYDSAVLSVRTLALALEDALAELSRVREATSTPVVALPARRRSD